MIFIILLVIAIVEFILIQNQFRKINDNAQLIDDAYLRYAYMMQIGTHVRTLMLYKDGTYPFSSEEEIDQIRQELGQAAVNLYDT